MASWIRRFAERVAPSESEIEAEELRARFDPLKCSLIAQAPAAVPIRVAGSIRSVTLRSRVQDPALEVELYDGSGSLTLVFLGRRAIRGLTPGRHLIARGRVTRRGSSPVMYNPTYDLLPQSA